MSKRGCISCFLLTPSSRKALSRLSARLRPGGRGEGCRQGAVGLGVLCCKLGQTPDLWPHGWTADLGAKTLGSTVGSATDQRRHTHLLASQVVLQDGGHLLGMRCCGGTHHAVSQTFIVGEKRLQPHESLFSHSYPFSSDWCLVAGRGTSGEGLSGSKSTAICCCEG